MNRMIVDREVWLTTPSFAFSPTISHDGSQIALVEYGFGAATSSTLKVIDLKGSGAPEGVVDLPAGTQILSFW